MAGPSQETRQSVAAFFSFQGFRFSPTDEELISYYLEKKMEGCENSVQDRAATIKPQLGLVVYIFQPLLYSDKTWKHVVMEATMSGQYELNREENRAQSLGNVSNPVFGVVGYVDQENDDDCSLAWTSTSSLIKCLSKLH
ncbi:hypothetical protein SAY86_022416 [Trapa natans]|uniref:NAC domain-containing protein n=1 Tax=Trapa natans TaxID=22666 RepID=A0AAN7LSZ6_TRANT|nr:hypothetical protein SAY86_022416 [Trapa natans]